MSPSGEILPADARAGWPTLILAIDGHIAQITSEDLKRNLLELGYVFLGAEWEDRLEPIVLKHDPKDARTPDEDRTLRGFTRDPAVLGVVQAFIASVDNDTFISKEVPVAA